MRNSAFVAVASVVGEAFLATRNQVPVNVLKEKSQGQPAGKCPINHPIVSEDKQHCCATIDCEAKIPCEQTTGCKPFRRDCKSINTKSSCVANYCWWKGKGIMLLRQCEPKKTTGQKCKADKECDRSLCERQKGQKEGNCGSALPVDPYVISDSYLERIHEWHEIPGESESEAITFECAATDKGTVRTLLLTYPPTSQSHGYAFLGFDVKLASSEIDYDLLKEIYTKGIEKRLDENQVIFAEYDITFFGKDLGGLMATLARTEIGRSNLTPNKSRVFAFMEDEENLSAFPSIIQGGGGEEDDLCLSTRIHGRPLVIQHLMRNKFKNVLPCSEYEGSFQVKRKTSWRTIVKSLGYGTTVIGVAVACGIALSNPFGLLVGAPLLLPLYLKAKKAENKDKKKENKKNKAKCYEA